MLPRYQRGLKLKNHLLMDTYVRVGTHMYQYGDRCVSAFAKTCMMGKYQHISIFIHVAGSLAITPQPGTAVKDSYDLVTAESYTIQKHPYCTCKCSPLFFSCSPQNHVGQYGARTRDIRVISTTL